jgi:hypothetical protein
MLFAAGVISLRKEVNAYPVFWGIYSAFLLAPTTSTSTGDFFGQTFDLEP